ncbi:substrate-binding domain-containing protein [uncultured Tateyamaria sp.]|uniref:substrate-binding domain-containing protein n=1 Tax=uncultured Tateyamaria sp. TaxID=455651 RepID=UPI002619D13F|nr:substrate-binding domain-containing protein [uncultured Tateyamaria sp.]
MAPPAPSNIERIAAILAGFDHQNHPRPTQVVLAEAGLSRSTGFGLIRALTQTGWLERADHGLLRLGPRAAELIFAPMEPPTTRAPVAVSARAGRTPETPMPMDDATFDAALVRSVDTTAFRAPPPYVFGFSNASTSNPWRQALVQSLTYGQGVARGQISRIEVRDAGDDPAQQLADIDALIEMGIDLLLISITSVTDRAISNRLAELADSGLPIVAVDRRPQDRASLVSFVTASDQRIGRMSALWLAEHLKGQGRVWMLSGLEGASPTIRRQQAALAVFDAFPGIHVENVSYTDWTAEGGIKAVRQLLEAEAPAPDGVWCDSGLQGVGSLRHFAGRNMPIPAHTGGDVNEMYKLCLTHKVPMAGLDYPAAMGARAITVALDILKGTLVPQRVEVPVQVVLPRGCETASVRADIWAELHVAWDLTGDTILSQGPTAGTGRTKRERTG